MNLKPLIAFVFGVGLLGISVPVFGHHGAASYDPKLTTQKGTVTDFRFINPHSEIYFDVTDASGNAQKWIAEAVSVASMSRDGWTKNTLKPGDRVTIIGNCAKNGSHSTRLSKIVLADGKSFTIERGEDYADQ
jgi:hypothetical protein